MPVELRRAGCGSATLGTARAIGWAGPEMRRPWRGTAACRRVWARRAAAVAEVDGPGPALALVDEIEGLDRYPLWHASRAELLRRLDRPADAADALRVALALPTSGPVRELLEGRLSGTPPRP